MYLEKNWFLTVGILLTVSSAAMATCKLHTAEKPNDLILQALESKGWEVYASKKSDSKFLSISEAIKEGDYVDGGSVWKQCFGHYKPSTLSVVLKIGDEFSDRYASLVSNIEGTGKYSLPCEYPQQVDTEVINKRESKARAQAIKEILTKIPNCKN